MIQAACCCEKEGERRGEEGTQVDYFPMWACIVYIVTLYAPYVAMPHIRIMRRDIAVAMQISADQNNMEDITTQSNNAVQAGCSQTKWPSQSDGGIRERF